MIVAQGWAVTSFSLAEPSGRPVVAGFLHPLGNGLFEIALVLTPAARRHLPILVPAARLLCRKLVHDGAGRPCVRIRSRAPGLLRLLPRAGFVPAPTCPAPERYDPSLWLFAED